MDLTERLPGRLEPLEWLVDTFARSSNSFRLPDALATLGDALVASGKRETSIGAAFREMGLLEEAIGEFQTVAKANDGSKAFRYGMQ
jgi:hypothetical protein